MTPHLELYACHIPSLEAGMIWQGTHRGRLAPSGMLRLIDKFTDIDAIYPLLENLLALSAGSIDQPRLEDMKLPVNAYTNDMLFTTGALVYVKCQPTGWANNGWPIAIVIDHSVPADHGLRQRIFSYGQ